MPIADATAITVTTRATTRHGFEIMAVSPLSIAGEINDARRENHATIYLINNRCGTPQYIPKAFDCRDLNSRRSQP
jgi:hypothetical protein